MDQTHIDNDAGLVGQDREALDALIQAQFELDRVDPAHRQRAAHIAGMLSLLDTPVQPSDRSLTDRVLAAVQREAHHTAADDTSSQAQAELCETDQLVLDALIDSAIDPTEILDSADPRSQRHARLALLIAAAPLAEDAPADLTDRTLSRVQQAINAQASRLDLSRRGRPRIRLADLVSVAAVVLIAASLIWPAMSIVRGQQRKSICQNNLQASAFGLSSYAGLNDDALPVVTAGLSGLPWWNVGTPKQSNSANLYHLAKGSYVDLAGLACPGNRQAPTAIADPAASDWRDLSEVSYSYRIMFGSPQPQWGMPSRVVILADRSPVVLRAVQGRTIDPWENSPNHGGSGQSVLFSDGSTDWMTSTMLETGDNIYLPRPIEQAIDVVRRRHRLPPILGTETPASLDDAFVGP